MLILFILAIWQHNIFCIPIFLLQLLKVILALVFMWSIQGEVTDFQIDPKTLNDKF